tara:strand:- start:2210 stop:2392 length:183 start_codon:yes stop_codon:yes gene_type:complete
MKTKTQQIHITKYPDCEYDKHGNETYREWSNGEWVKLKYDDKGRVTYYEFNDGLKVYSII